MKISTILDQIDLGSLALPEFQRGYVWNREQVRGLMASLYRRYPVGSLLVWETQTDEAHARGNGALAPGVVNLLLDGQQRITSLYGIIRGRPPRFFDGNASTFTGLHFNLEDESFEFYTPAKMKDNPVWINVTELMQKGIAHFFSRVMATPQLAMNADVYVNRLNAIAGIKDIDLHIEKVTGADKTIDVVVDIFNRVNSGGTKLSQGDLALAKVCAGWPDARDELKKRLRKWRNAGFDFRLEWLLRCVNTVATGEALFSALRNVSSLEFQASLVKAEKAIDYLLNLISSRLGLDNDQVLGSPYSLALMARYVVQQGGSIADYRERDKLLYWYILTVLWGRYSGSTETVLNQDLALIEQKDGALDRLIEEIRRRRVDLRLQARDFIEWSRSARFYPLLYMLTRVYHARDWDSGLELSQFLLGHLSGLQVHHIFPKDVLYKHGYTRPEVNAVANFTFLTQATNLKVTNREPKDYLPEFEAKHPGVIASHWIPTDPVLWTVDRYRDFLAARRELLAKAANEFLDSLVGGSAPQVHVAPPVLERTSGPTASIVVDQHDEQMISECIDWIAEQKLPEGELKYELTDPTTGEPLAVVDLAWPNGLQGGLSQPVAVVADSDSQLEQILNRFGYRYFSDLKSFQDYVRREILAIDDTAVAV